MTTSEGKTEALRERLSSRIPAGGKDGPTKGVNHIREPHCSIRQRSGGYRQVL